MMIVNKSKIVLMFLSVCLISSAHAAKYYRNYVPGEMIVKYKNGLSSAAQNNSLEREGLQRIKRLNNRGINQVRLPRGRDLKAAIDEIKLDPNVEFAQPNFIYRISTTPNDTRYGQLWGLKNSAQTIISPGGPDSPSGTNNPGTSGKDMDLENAWSKITDCSSVTVAILDTGVNYNHEDLAANMWDGGVAYPKHGYDFVGTDTNDPLDQNGHGTHVAGTIGAVGNNNKGTTGVCWGVKLMAIRVLDATGSGTTSDIVQGIDFAVANGAKVINMSLGGSSFDAAYSTSIDNARNNGVVVVAAAGNENTNNDGGTHSYPCDFTQANVVCVAALSQNYSLASFSNYGVTSVDIGAPGVNIVSTWPGTHTTTSDPLTAGWTFSSTTASPWAYKSLNFGVATNTLANPANYNQVAKYNHNTDDRAYKSFNLAGKNVAILNFYLMWDTEVGQDYVTVHANTAGGDPIPAGDELDYFDGNTGTTRYAMSYDITPYISATTGIGFNLTSNGTVNGFGSNVSLFSLETLAYNNTTYNVISGTSMATPHVAGLAAMIFAYNPNYTYSDVVASLKNGGVTTASLSGKTTTGKAASASGSLSYIIAPTGGAAVKLP